MSSTTLTPSERAAIRVRITKLEEAYDAIVSGKALKRFIDQNGESVEYNTGNLAQLLKLINELKSMIDCSFNRRYKPRPVGFVFPRQ
jgi:hypothetical protein